MARQWEVSETALKHANVDELTGIVTPAG